ncbi:regulator of g protein signaling [Anaeramoeba flamelloides]|uniref:Regulator of g protein signaling n=1 Tax=Anaeramoeba flamelloides TaxID=1746091 RepID=A0ABQ8YPL6_9EUKA|nr:regulator of g protein signaling [Anaeramoeba flamelloides]
MNAKRLFVQIANQDSKSISETETTSGKKDTEPSSDENNAETYLGSLNIDIKLKEVERNFYKKRAKYSNKIQSVVLAVIYIILALVVVLLLVFGDVKQDDQCNLDSNLVVSVSYSLGIFFTVILIIKCIQIRKINDVFKMRNEIYQFLALSILSYIIMSIIYGTDSFSLQYSFYVLGGICILYTIAFGYPLYLSYQKKFSIANIEKNNSNKEKNSYQKFIDLIKNPEKVKYFIEFSKMDFSVENILFYRSVKAYQSLNIKYDRKRLCKKIIDNFIKNCSKLEINIASDVRKNILETTNMKRPQRDCFDQALQDIIELMYINSYPSFLQHNLYSEMIINTDTIDKHYFLKVQSSDDIEDHDQQKEIKLKELNTNKIDNDFDRQKESNCDDDDDGDDEILSKKDKQDDQEKEQSKAKVGFVKSDEDVTSTSGGEGDENDENETGGGSGSEVEEDDDDDKNTKK